MNQSLNKFNAILIKNGFKKLMDVPYQATSFTTSDQKYLFRLVYLGRKQIYTNKFAKPLVETQLHNLQQLGISVVANQFTYQSGLVNISTANGQPVDIVAFNQNIIDLLDSMNTNPTSAFAKSVTELCESIAYGLFLQQQLPTESCTSNKYVACYRQIFEEQQAQLAELCTFFVPVTFLLELSEPAHFITRTAKLIGVLLFQTIVGKTNVFHYRPQPY